jgi:hypothetical protein
MCSHDLVGAGVLRSARPHAKARVSSPSGWLGPKAAAHSELARFEKEHRAEGRKVESGGWPSPVTRWYRRSRQRGVPVRASPTKKESEVVRLSATPGEVGAKVGRASASMRLRRGKGGRENPGLRGSPSVSKPQLPQDARGRVKSVTRPRPQDPPVEKANASSHQKRQEGRALSPIRRALHVDAAPMPNPSLCSRGSLGFHLSVFACGQLEPAVEGRHLPRRLERAGGSLAALRLAR